MASDRNVLRYGFYVRPSDGSTQFHAVDDGAYVRFVDYEHLRVALECIRLVSSGPHAVALADEALAYQPPDETKDG